MVKAYADQMGVVAAIPQWVPTAMAIAPGTIVLGLLLETWSGRSPLSRLAEVCAQQATARLLGKTVAPEAWHDATVGRVVARLSDTGTMPVLTAGAVRADQVCGLDQRSVHGETTAVRVSGASLPPQAQPDQPAAAVALDDAPWREHGQAAGSAAGCLLDPGCGSCRTPLGHTARWPCLGDHGAPHPPVGHRDVPGHAWGSTRGFPRRRRCRAGDGGHAGRARRHPVPHPLPRHRSRVRAAPRRGRGSPHLGGGRRPRLHAADPAPSRDCLESLGGRGHARRDGLAGGGSPRQRAGQTAAAAAGTGHPGLVWYDKNHSPGC